MKMGGSKEEVENGTMKACPTELEDALYLAGTGKFHYLLLISSGIGLVGIMMETFVTSFLLPSAQCDFNLSPSDKGLLNALYPVGVMCGSHMWGYLADTRGRKKILVASFSLDSLCAILSSFSHAFWLLLVFRFLCGFFISAGTSVIYAHFGEFHSKETRNKGLMLFSIFIGLGFGIQPGIAWLILPHTWEWYLPWCIYKSWRLFIIVCAMPNLIYAVLLALGFPETPKFLMSQGKNEEALKVLQNIYSCNTGSSAENYPVRSIILIEEGATQISSSDSGLTIVNLIASMWNQTVPLFKPPFLWKTLLACFVQYGLYASTNGLSLWLPDIFNHQALYYSLHPDSHPSICQILNTNPISDLALTNKIFNSALQKPSLLNLHENDILTFSCENTTLMLNINNSTDVQINPDPNILKCQGGLLLHNLSQKSLQLDVQNEPVILTILNITALSHLFQYETEILRKEPVLANDIECNSDVDISAYQNTLITGAVSAFSYLVVGYLIGPLGKKPIIMGSLLFGGAAGLFLDYVNANWEFFVLSLAFVILSGMCITVMISAVVEIFPTNLRAMAVSLSLMCGRMGSFTAHMLMGSLLQTNCVLMTYLLGGICTCCGLVAFFLPSSKKKK